MMREKSDLTKSDLPKSGSKGSFANSKNSFIVDVHAHIYPEKIAELAVRAIGEFYGLGMQCDGGTADQLLELAASSPISHHVVCSVAANPRSVETINNYIAGECGKHSQFIGFATMHPLYDDPISELERARDLGLRGVKIHPDIQKVAMNDPRLMNIYEYMEDVGMPLLLHAGDYRYDYSTPQRLVEVLKSFPDLRVNAAHMGGWSLHDVALEYLEYENCFVDCSSSLAFIGDRRLKELVRIYGADRVLFGSDYPMWNPKSEYERFSAIGLSDAEYEKIFLKNVERFLEIKLTKTEV